MLIKKIRALRLELFQLKYDYESIIFIVSPKDANFAELKLQDWFDFDSNFRETLVDIREELQSLMNGTSSYLRGDSSETQTEVIKLSKEAARIKQNVDATLKLMIESKKKELSLDNFHEVGELQLKMERLEVEIVDDYKNVRQSCLKGLSQFSDDKNLEKIRKLVERLSKFGFINFPENMLIGFMSK